eukprot:scaffold121060_cov17-Prasinocladus_malaysianus.AAC.1
MDDGDDGRPTAELAGQAIRALLMDRSPLLMNRGFRGAMNKKKDAKVKPTGIRVLSWEAPQSVNVAVVK